MSDALARLYPAHLQTVRRHFDAALAAAGFDQAVIYAGAPHLQFLDDTEYPFKVNPHFKYWLPLTDAPESFLSYTPSRQPVLVFHQPHDYWYLPPQAPAGYWVAHYDIRIIRTAAEARRALEVGRRCAFIGEWQARFHDWGFAEVNPEALLNPLHYARAAKSDYEVECMRRATQLAVEGHAAAAGAFRAGGSEFDIHQAFLAACRQTDEELPYHAIIALNEHAATLHYQKREREKPARHYSFLIDAAAQMHGYASDVTRTYSAENDEFQALIEALDREQQALAAEVKPGLDFKALHLKAHRAIGRLLEAFEFVRLPAEEIFTRGITRAFLPHGLGHFLGLQVHDVGGRQAGPAGGEIPRPDGHPYLRTTRVLGENFVVTIEPGLYFIETLLTELKRSEHAQYVNWAKLEAFRKYGGIRIEDNVVAKPAGPENLTREAFKSIPSSL